MKSREEIQEFREQLAGAHKRFQAAIPKDEPYVSDTPSVGFPTDAERQTALETTPIGDRMKSYERESDYRLEKDSLWVIRLDGHKFSKFTKKIGVIKPFDGAFSYIMNQVARALMDKFNFVTVFTQSDEITCVPNLRPEDPSVFAPMYNLRVQKLCSLVSAYASVVFYKEFRVVYPHLWDEVPIFDARIFELPTEPEVFNAILWRQWDGIKNAKNMSAQKYFSHKQLQGLTADEQIDLVQREKGVKFFDYPSGFIYGSLYKKRQVVVQGHNPKNDTYEESLRGVITEFNEPLTFTDATLDFILRKYV